MIDKNSQIFLTYKLGGESLVKAGVYKSAKVLVKNVNTDKEVVVVLEPMQVIEKPKYSYATMTTILGSEFIEAALERPIKPEGRNIHWWFRTIQGQLFLNWNKLSDEKKLEMQVISFVEDMRGELIDWEIL